MRGFTVAANVTLPMAMDRDSPSVESLTWLLQCFKGPAEEFSWAKGKRLFKLQDDNFSIPLQWLATMIIRSSADMKELPETVRATRYLGDLDGAKYAEYIEYCTTRTMECNPREGSYEAGRPSRLGFWLPHGIRASTPLDFAQDLRACLERFNRIEACYKEWFGLLDDLAGADNNEFFKIGTENGHEDTALMMVTAALYSRRHEIPTLYTRDYILPYRIKTRSEKYDHKRISEWIRSFRHASMKYLFDFVMRIIEEKGMTIMVNVDEEERMML